VLVAVTTPAVEPMNYVRKDLSLFAQESDGTCDEVPATVSELYCRELIDGTFNATLSQISRRL
jgi:hypothetical protein